MYGGKNTLYDILGVPRDATQKDIVMRYRRLASDYQKESSAPNPRREALLHEAYEVLSDPQKREAYDKSLRQPQFTVLPKGEKKGAPWGLLGIAAALGLGALWYFTWGSAPKEAPRIGPGASLQEVQAAATVAVGRVNRVEISGARSNLATAVAVEEGVMMAPCKGIAPGVQLLVRIPPRDIPAQLRHSDEAIGLCKLSVSGGASWPLPMTGVPPRPGDKVYAVNLNSLGEAVVTAGEVQKIKGGTHGSIVESTARVGPPADGSPLLDAEGRVLAIALQGHHTTLPKAWIVDVPIVKRPPPQKPSDSESTEATSPAPAEETDPRLRNVPPEKRERLEKAFRPPPSVPKDL